MILWGLWLYISIISQRVKNIILFGCWFNQLLKLDNDLLLGSCCYFEIIYLLNLIFLLAPGMIFLYWLFQILKIIYLFHCLTCPISADYSIFLSKYIYFFPTISNKFLKMRIKKAQQIIILARLFCLAHSKTILLYLGYIMQGIPIIAIITK